ncbi:MAG: DUF4954 family protein [Prevotellaceae bacterium]|jgi:acetyltransferase-like isoleucine patch superfamily enzyme|nr:DUF4954 family protein [Prevotellaceae bacterium]
MRQLTTTEIMQLEQQGCSADYWHDVLVADGFQPAHIRRVKFTGKNQLGIFDTEITLQGGVKAHTGITDAWLHNCTVGNNVFIRKICDYIGNYVIEDHAVVFDVGLLVTDGDTTFGNGLKIHAVSSTGSRAVMMYNRLSAPLAYVLATYRHRPQLIANIEKLITEYSETQRSRIGRIAQNAALLRCDALINVNVGEHALLEDVQKLKNGTIVSETAAPTYIGSGCNMENFIVCAGAEVCGNVQLSHCFIGQSCKIGKQYSATHSLFFANCECFQGEASSVFAGPYTVTHHKSTLLIAGMYSFMNAGSGANQSNHLYKLGAIHHGFAERGVKLASDAYMMFPAHIGAFTLVAGRHYQHPDTADFPFSYLTERGGRSYLSPAVNLRCVGIVRDVQKWRDRDQRKAENRLDDIHYPLLTPYIVERIIKGRDILLRLRHEHKTEYLYKGIIVKHDVLDRGITLYNYALDTFLGDAVMLRLEKTADTLTEENIRESLKSRTEAGGGKWIDAAGLVCPESVLHAALKDIELGTESDLNNLHGVFKTLHQHYDTYAWTWTRHVLQQTTAKNPDTFTAQDVTDIIHKGLDAAKALHNLWCEDAKKEFTQLLEEDSEQVYGAFDAHETVLSIKQHIHTKEMQAKKLLQQLKQVHHS